jgi:hypothetical protein
MRFSPVGTLRPVAVGLYFNLETWDGSDFFVPGESGYIIVTEKVKTAVEKTKFSNIELRSITEIESL